MKALGIQQVSACGPIPMLIGEYAIEYQDFLAAGVVVAGKRGAGFVAHYRGDLAGLCRADPMYPFACNMPPGTRRPCHTLCVYCDPKCKITVQWSFGFFHGVSGAGGTAVEELQMNLPKRRTSV